ncbi:alpha/beta fold hydrolase [Catenuloplanes atrovinosus]|uniref:Pimeloyl-ACP methyl ester carboxylesterase n=1 Tax=Catenuloplanes atrovinosus TaxID=137266 RepID=A0AAE4C904_9ACTN|nr:alpha/beta fold hydrolase [Catenuloplanes atrovinosus]MDR7275202.1 pimeloyl-ACP methyl ester carboxylesterase [Catenuloplanes atrovinosus]
MRRSTAGAAIMLTTALVITGSGVPASAAVDPFAAFADQEVTWGPCAFTPEPDARPAECAVITVARDWATPGNGRTIQVSISRIAPSGEKLGSLLINPGGPGVQATSMPSALAAAQPGLHERYALIGMDPRGTGQQGGNSPEAETCAVPLDRLSQRLDLDARDRSAESIAEHQKAPRAIAEACQSVALAPFITTWQTAHDMELIRILLGEPRLDYLGYSYGTWLGAKYASLFPGSAGKMVLDSNVNFQGRYQAAFESWPPINQRLLDDQFLPWMARQFPDVVGATPAEAKASRERGRAWFAAQGESPDVYDRVFVGMGSSQAWVVAALVFVLSVSGADQEEPTLVDSALAPALDARSRERFGLPLAELTPAAVAEALADDPEDYLHAPVTRFAVACGDQPTRSAAWYKRLSDEQGPRYPLFGWLYGIGLEPCAFWSDAPRQELPQLPAEVTGRVLMVQSEFDPQTGYEQARAAAQAAPGVSMISVDDSPFHGQYAFEGNPCVDGMVNVFLLRNSRPGSATCPGLPLPEETEVFPVDGPVRTRAAATMSESSVAPLAELRAEVQNMISEGNTPLGLAD